jgi:hypothetical protein
MHFATYAESLDGEVGLQYVEVRAGRVVRQIMEFGCRLYWSHPDGEKDHRYFFTDQPEWSAGEGAIDLREVTSAEFESLWRRRPPELSE